MGKYGEPWIGDKYEIKTRDGDSIASRPEGLLIGWKRAGDRIIACVNACDTIDDPHDLRAQRDALLKACELTSDNLVLLIRGEASTTGELVRWMDFVVEAIAKANGKSTQ